MLQFSTLQVHAYLNMCTMLQKLPKCEVKAALPLRFGVKSNLSQLKRSKNVIFGSVRGSVFQF